jgi:hypothetical protein
MSGPGRHRELDEQKQPTQQIVESRRRVSFITPIPKPRKRKGSATQQQMVFDERKGLSSRAQQYGPTPIINELRPPAFLTIRANPENGIDPWGALAGRVSRAADRARACARAAA